MSTRIPAGGRQSNINTVTTGGAKSAANKRVDRTESASSVSSVKQSYAVKQQYLTHLQQRPHLIAALSDGHRTVNRLMMSSVLLKQIAKSLMAIDSIVKQDSFTPELMNQVDIEKKAIMAAINTKMFGDYVLDSSFAPIAEMNQGIEFTVAGLDLKRERLTTELVTLYINQHMVPLAFDRTERDTVLFEQFSLMFAYSNMRLTLGDEKQLIISMPDNAWRMWDLNIHISGQGGRYSDGAPVTIPVTPLHATIENVTMLDMRSNNPSEQLAKVINRVNDLFKATQTSLKTQQENADQIIGLCTKVDADIGNRIQQQFTDNPQQSLRAIQKHYIGPNRENVVGLLG